MARKYIRQVRVTLSGGGAYIVTGCMIEFDVEKTISSVPNSGVVRIWNLSKSTRNAVGKEFDSIQVEAGYAEIGLGIILKGKIREVFHRRDETDVITEIAVGDGDLADRTGFVAKTYPAGTEIRDIVEDIYQNSMPGITRGELKGLDDLPAVNDDVTLVAPTRRAMDELGRTNDFYWSYQNETLETIPADGYLAYRVLISPESGMVGVPTVTDRGVVVQALLDPAIRPNRIIEVRSETLEMNDAPSTYRVNGVRYFGDNMDGDFTVEVEGEKITQGKVTG